MNASGNEIVFTWSFCAVSFMFVDFAVFDFDSTLVMTYEHETQNMQMHLIAKSSCILPQIYKKLTEYF